MAESNRIDYIDLAKGFCILLVVLNHANVLSGDLDYLMRDALCAMRMPLYFFLSGLFFKPYESYMGFLKRKVNKLLIPFLFFRIISCLITPLVSGKSVEWFRMWDFLVGPMHAPNTPIWFLICLFVLNQIFYGIYKIANYTREPLIALIFLSLLLGVAGYYSGKTGFSIRPMNISTAMTAIPFFCVGYLFKSHTSILYPNRWDKYLVIVSIGCAIYTWAFAKSADYFTNYYGGDIWATYSCGITGILCVLFISKKIGHLPLISYFGRYSIMILVTHLPIIQRILPLMARFGFSPWFNILGCSLVVMLSCLFLIPVMKKYLPYVTAQKDVIPI